MTTLSRKPPAQDVGIVRIYDSTGWSEAPAAPPKETGLALMVNGQQLLTIMCTPEKLNCLVLGFLMGQGLISGMGDVISMGVCPDELVAEVIIKGTVNNTARKVATSGCGAGISLEIDSGLAPVESKQCFLPEQILNSVRLLLGRNIPEPSPRQHGLHSSILTDGASLVAEAHDIGRHNTIDKIWGECLLRKIPTSDKILVSTGRISSEMVIKAVKMRVPLVASLNSATDRAVEMGARFGVAVAGYARAGQFQLYCGQERILDTTR
jgi:FdhD protein